MVVGLTGGIGSGKSTVSAGLGDRGAAIVDADKIARSVQRGGEPVFAKIVEHFGPKVVGPDGELDRIALAHIVFSDPAQLRELESFTHPAVGAEIARQVVEASRREDVGTVVVLDIPLLVESGAYQVNGVIVVDCPPDLAVARLVEQRGMNEADARARIANQASRDERQAVADFVIDNSGDRAALEDQIDSAWDWAERLGAYQSGS